MKKIGLAIALDNSATYHTQTFIEAIDYSLDNFPSLSSYAFKTVSDEKTQQGGAKAAKKLVEWGADIVIGHFSSVAAISAIPYYAAANIPIILPAASSCLLDLLPANELQLTYKYQKSNKALVEHCIFDCIARQGSGSITIIAQDNEYGNTLSKRVPLIEGITIINTAPAQANPDDTYIIFGYDDFAQSIVKKLSKISVYRIVLIDDSDCDDVYNAVIVKPHFLSRVKAVFDIPRHARTSPFWNETLLALALGDSILTTPDGKPSHPGKFDTYLTDQHFDVNNRYNGNALVAEDIDY